MRRYIRLENAKPSLFSSSYDLWRNAHLGIGGQRVGGLGAEDRFLQAGMNPCRCAQ